MSTVETYKRASFGVIKYCSDNNIPVRFIYNDGTEDIVKVIHITKFEYLVRDNQEDKDFIIPKHSIKKIQLEGNIEKMIEGFRKSLKEKNEDN